MAIQKQSRKNGLGNSAFTFTCFKTDIFHIIFKVFISNNLQIHIYKKVISIYLNIEDVWLLTDDTTGITINRGSLKQNPCCTAQLLKLKMGLKITASKPTQKLHGATSHVLLTRAVLKDIVKRRTQESVFNWWKENEKRDTTSVHFHFSTVKAWL